MKCWNCNMEMQKFPNIRGLTEPLLVFEDDFEENGLVAGSYDTLVNTIEHKEKTIP